MHGNILHRASPNFGPRRDGLTPSLVVLHYTAMQSATAALDRLCEAGSDVSAHYLIGIDGTVWQLVDEEQRAWHAGAGEWHGQDDINSRSIGIELDNPGNHPFSEPQMAALERVLTGVVQRWSIPPNGVIAHSDMAPGRKCDPGPRFDWARLARRGLAQGPARPEPANGADTGRFRPLARAAGYTADVPDQILLKAFRLRFRPWGRGAISPADIGILAGLTGRGTGNS